MMKRFRYALLFLFVFTACSTEDEEVTVVHNVNGYTIQDNRLIQFEALSMQGGRVLETGTFMEVTAYHSDAELIDGEGRTLLPGLIDAHGHIMNLGFQEMDVNLSGIQSLEETLQAVAEHADNHPESEWILGRGWNQVLWDENEFPTAADLDRVISDRPVWLRRVDGHAGWANTLAMERAGIAGGTPDPQGGRIIRDEEGRATGIFIDTAMGYLTDELPPRTPAEREQALMLALDRIASLGITSVHDAGISDREWELYTKLADEGGLPVRIYAMIRSTGDAFDRLSEEGPVEGYADDMLAMRAVKISADGALGSRGAALLEEYSDDPGNHGLLFFDQEELDEMILKGASAGYQMNIHAIGDAANRQVLNAFERLRSERGADGLRHRIEHAQVVHPEDIPRFQELDVIASMQPTHATSDMNMAEDRVGADRIEGAYAWRTFLNQGTGISAGSDFPVEAVNPFYGLYSAVTRMDHDGQPEGGWYPEQSMTLEEAFRAFTVDAAWSAHQEEILGSLEPGKWADFILLDRDPFSVPAEELWQVDVLETWVAGEQVYRAQ
ncbi:MAG: amidohydrolase [Balneolaceae bacterium]